MGERRDSRRSCTATRARPACANWSGASAGSRASSRAARAESAGSRRRPSPATRGVRRGARATISRRCSASRRIDPGDTQPRGQGRRRHRARVHQRGRRHLEIEVSVVPRPRQAAAHGYARRRDEGIGQRRAELRAHARRRSASTATSIARATCTCTSPPARRPRTGQSAGIAIAPAIVSALTGHSGARRRRDDRRDHAARPRAGDRRPEGEGGRRPSQAVSRT